MKKVILNIAGAEELVKNVQKYLNGDMNYCATEKECGNPPSGKMFKCVDHTCKLEMMAS
jgi:hypothetical protein